MFLFTNEYYHVLFSISLYLFQLSLHASFIGVNEVAVEGVLYVQPDDTISVFYDDVPGEAVIPYTFDVSENVVS